MVLTRDRSEVHPRPANRVFTCLFLRRKRNLTVLMVSFLMQSQNSRLAIRVETETMHNADNIVLDDIERNADKART